MPSEPGWSGSDANNSRPNSVTGEGLGCTVAPHSSIMVLRYGF